MATTKSTRNTGKPWTAQEVKELKLLAKQNTPTRVIGVKLGRTPRAIQSKASEQGISLAPPNRSPYGQASESGASRKRSGGRAGTTGRRAMKTGARKRAR